MLLFLNPTIKTQWKVWLFIQTFHCFFQHIHRRSSSFSALWIYTILKPKELSPRKTARFTTLWIYTILKPRYCLPSQMASFTTLWIYTILKPICGKEHYQEVSLPYGFTLFSNQMTADLAVGNVSLPYGFTLFSNCGVWIRFAVKVSLPYGFTLFSNNSSTSERFIEFHYLMDLHYSQT